MLETKLNCLKHMPKLMKSVIFSSILVLPSVVSAQEKSAESLYQEHCQSCHGVERMGAMGPALFPENLSRLRKNKATKVIQNGRVATQMPSFSEKLSVEQTKQLVDYIYTKPKTELTWSMADIKASNIQHFDQS